ncbi:MAG: Tn3 family transposase [Proteobacteria bacterium]|nr:Tn3 family transposase [Pseudomonadota bacterium]
MPRKSILSAAECNSLLAFPEDKANFIRYYTFDESDLSIIKQHRGSENRLGFAVQLCYLRFPGIILGADELPFQPLLEFVAEQIKVPVKSWEDYGRRDQTRREHLTELQTVFGFKSFSADQLQKSVQALTDLALQTNKGILLAKYLLDDLRQQNIIIPAIKTIESICSEAITRANRLIYSTLTSSLLATHRQRLDELLELKDDSNTTWLAWLRQSPSKPNSRHMIEHIERLKFWQVLDLPVGIEKQIHQNRLLKIAREAGQMRPAELSKLESDRRYATLTALALESMATVTDEIIDLHDRIMARLFSTAKNKHQKKFHESGKAINEKVHLYGKIGQALLAAKQNGTDPFLAIDSVIPWETFIASIEEAQTLAQPEDFDFLHHVGESYATLRRYVSEFLDVLKINAAPTANSLLKAIEILRAMNSSNARKIPIDAPTDFIKKRWAKLVMTEEGIDRRYYELCVLSELKNSLRSGDIWVKGSRQFKDFEEYLIPAKKFSDLKLGNKLPLTLSTNCDQYLQNRLSILEKQLALVSELAATNDLPDAIITESGLKITPLDATVPEEAQSLISQSSALLPRVKITELLIEVDEWTDFTKHFTHLKSSDRAKDKKLLLTTILADGINIGLAKMAESCPGTSYAKLSWLQAWHIRDETYSAALGELVNAQLQEAFSKNWGDVTTSSSDGQRFRANSKAESTGHINPKYGAEPGRMFYTHISDTYSPFSIKVVNVGVRDSTYVLDGLLYHESDLRIQEHYTDTAGFTDHVFGLMHLLDFRFAPRIRDLGDTKLFIPKSDSSYDSLKSMISSDRLNTKAIYNHWDDIIRLATSIKQGTVTASLMLRKLGSYPRQNGLAIALRELGRIERTLFILDWIQNVELRRKVNAGLNKGEARNALARAVFFHRLGEIRDRSFEQQSYRANGLNLVTAAIILWNTVYLERATNFLREQNQLKDESLLKYLSPLGWEHINLTGDYLWNKINKSGSSKFKPLRQLQKA